MITVSKYTGILLLMALLSACAPAVHTDFDRAFNFGTLKSYALMPAEPSQAGPLLQGPLIDKRLNQALQNGLIANGYNKSSHPDFYVRYRLATKTEISGGSGLGYGLGYFGGNMGVGMHSGGYPQQSDKAVLTISFYDGKDQSILLWRGVTEKRISKHNTGAGYIDRLIDELVDVILSKFPPVRK